MPRPTEDDPKVQRAVYPRLSLWQRIEAAAKADGDRPVAQFTAKLLQERMDEIAPVVPRKRSAK